LVVDFLTLVSSLVCLTYYDGRSREDSIYVLSSLSIRIKECASHVGFDLCGIASVADFAELKAFPPWIADAKHGDMKYMEARNDAGDLKRASLVRVAPWARSVVVCAINYNTDQPYSNQSPPESEQFTNASRGWISRYAWGQEDYHDSVLRRLRQLEDKLGGLNAADSKDAPTPPQFRSYVDTGHLIERVYAKYAGVGWLGKNTCIINQQLGSWLFLGVILTSLEFNKNKDEQLPNLPAPDRCGTCTRCIVACPTQAITAPGVLDARLCISYLTIEKRGAIPLELRSEIGRHVFGCDICQDVCPWNRKAPATSSPEFAPREGLVNPALDWLAEMQQNEFRSVFRGSPVRRAKLSGLRRNAVIAMGNSGDQKFLPTLRKLADDPDPIVADHARWALVRLDSSAVPNDLSASH
jgi:epoxyqueuosine reductase